MAAPKEQGIFKFQVAGDASTLDRVFARRTAPLIAGRSQASAAEKARMDATSRAAASKAQGQRAVQAMLQGASTRQASIQATAANAMSASMLSGLSGLLLGQKPPAGDGGGDGGPGGGPGGGGGGGGQGGGPPGGDLSGHFNPAQWMKNNSHGHADYDRLVSVGLNGLPSTNGHWYLRPDAAAAFLAMDKAYFKDTGQHLQLASAYRDFGTPYENGRDWRDSDHASGGAIDICGTDCPASKMQALEWMKRNAAKFGYGVWGGAWGDDGHFSFSAGGFQGWMTHYEGPTAADLRWIRLANQWFYG